MAILEDPPIRDKIPSRNWIRWFIQLKDLVLSLATGSGFVFTASRAIKTNAAGELTAATATATELEYLQGLTGSIQTQLNSKIPATPTSQAAHIANPTGGGTVDAQSRDAINSILVVLENFGLTASS